MPGRKDSSCRVRPVHPLAGLSSTVKVVGTFHVASSCRRMAASLLIQNSINLYNTHCYDNPGKNRSLKLSSYQLLLHFLYYTITDSRLLIWCCRYFLLHYPLYTKGAPGFFNSTGHGKPRVLCGITTLCESSRSFCGLIVTALVDLHGF